MNFHQLQYAVAIARHGLSVTQAASALGTSQPAISRALKALERELGFDLFVREGRAFSRITPQGAQVLEYATRALAEIASLKAVAADLNHDNRGTLSIATTHTQARYVLPPVVQAFRERYPEVELHLHQGTSEQIAEMVATDRVQLAIATGSDALFPGLVLLPVYRWHRQVIVPKRHPLAGVRKLTLQELAKYPLVTYVFSFSGGSSLQNVFSREGLSPKVALTARDSDVIKTYVRLGLGVGIVASVAIEPAHDADLRGARRFAFVPDPHHLGGLPPRHAAAQFRLRFHAAVWSAPEPSADRPGHRGPRRRRPERVVPQDLTR